ncbi:diacylglycerol kinase [Permianibacter aggregans]|uniref:Diacylglycerol kinase n=1 Tax=Permianibacter aggregans TaxID=1510150 RepID=A0A4R6UWK4_9GAMM|nr:diacylglycerol kinase [Permianibacter aggregans]QGX39361.1 diacylglycerol kinase [Permianibacter aggregans]TDQ49905.1 diacylglycerol kinase (ATP) [Permianibacter aggregans]
MAKPGKTGFVRLFDAFGYSMKGFKAAWQNEAAFRQEAVLALVLIPLAFIIAENPLELAALVAGVLLVIITELLNSAIESVVDRTGHEHHELSGRAKDMGSAAVLISLLVCAVLWGAVLWRYV